MSKNRRSSKQTLSIVILLIVLAAAWYLTRDTQTVPAPSPADPTVVDNLDQPTVHASLPASIPLSSDAEFDYYVLSLSWSPQYCAAEGSDDSQQCSLGRKLGFVLHGLWPQYENGYPESCTNEDFPTSLKKDFPALYPSDALYTHEWEKHGTCSGLSPEEYLTASQALRDFVVIPADYLSPTQPLRVTVDQLHQEFIESNPWLAEDGLAVLCSDSGRYLQEIRVCFTIEGQPRACSADLLKDAAKSCGGSSLLVRNVK